MPYQETVRVESSIVALSKSQNKHNRLYVKAMPLGEELTNAIEDGKFNIRDEAKIRARALADEYGWDITDARKIWSFGPDMTGANILVDATKGVQYMNEIRDSCSGAFQWATKAGVICEEAMRGVRVNILDVTVRLYHSLLTMVLIGDIYSFIPMQFIEAVARSCLRCAALRMRLAFWQTRRYRSQSTLVSSCSLDCA